jgi:hypothetical protein
MLRLFCILVFGILAGPLRAQDCPDFFRFVDFGQLDRNSETHRGGTVFRAEGFEGEALLRAGETVCLSVSELAKDGRGNPVPVVSLIGYDTVKTNIDLQSLYISRVSDPADAAVENARAHLALLDQSGTIVQQGSNFLCANQLDTSTASCQIASPFGDNLPLVVYCDAAACNMAVMALNDHLIARAVWTTTDTDFADLELVAAGILSRVQTIHAFLSPLSSGL